MAEVPELACPVMSAATDFHAEEAGIEVGEEAEHLSATQGLTQPDLSLVINAM